jgi:hypothetical protein
MAERGGFEPPIGFNTYGGLANRCLKPLGHLSNKRAQKQARAVGDCKAVLPAES